LDRLNDKIKNHDIWQEKHKLPASIKAGSKIDALDTEHIWCKATIELKISAQN
jgi:hypothetical protein